MKPRKVELVNIKTGEKVSGGSTREFCEKSGLEGNDRFHLTPLLNKKALIFKGWVLPEFYELVTKKHDWQDRFGNEFESLSVLEVMEKLEEKYFSPAIKKFLLQNTSGFKGLYLKSRVPQFVYQARTVEEYTLVKGRKRYTGKNKVEVAAKAGIASRSVWAMERGIYPSVKGVSIESIKLKNKSVL